MALLEVADLRTSFYTDEGEVVAVDTITFEVDIGETLALVGESGCGKSVTALSLMRLVSEPGRITGGRIALDGVDLLALSDDGIRRLRGRELAMIFQDPMSSLNPVLTVGQQISEALRLHLRLDKSAARSRSIELLELVGIPSPATRVDDYPHQFSGGMRQRVMIAMAISCQPKLVIADEITTALDVTVQVQILDLLKRLAADTDMAFVLITHDLQIVADMAQRVHVMYAGRIVEMATTSELFADPRMPYTWGLLGSSPTIDQGRHERLTPIEGLPPNLADPPPACRFEPRCRYARDICRTAEPALLQIAGADEGHRARCWGTQEIDGGGWLRGLHWDAEGRRLMDGGSVAAANADQAKPMHPSGG